MLTRPIIPIISDGGSMPSWWWWLGVALLVDIVLTIAVKTQRKRRAQTETADERVQRELWKRRMQSIVEGDTTAASYYLNQWREAEKAARERPATHRDDINHKDRIMLHHMRFESGVECPWDCPDQSHRSAS